MKTMIFENFDAFVNANVNKNMNWSQWSRILNTKQFVLT